ncbi:transcription factor with AP2 domain(s), putative (ApiAP2) [Plasmodium ovale wallikeri]|uniref:Transcription factor with AP2 domain(S), putative (ApiAP2) n=1 Tax=Plasmodium ovale wallikeri TaxID=864142 RepID=A0A1A8ZDS9_PLAOA|nr:transcription factor with AP2 domain(s), putative (ApiAP2) [Plasmodium ovale wallikeri]SBT42395.1 transcription factor with AP2 domain(s), putative (ApiAP2) [Plasmodium ovale wallikeri]
MDEKLGTEHKYNNPLVMTMDGYLTGNNVHNSNPSCNGNNGKNKVIMSNIHEKLEDKDFMEENPVVIPVKKKVGRPKGTGSANKIIKKEEKVSTSSSGYPGVSWNKRMCAWLAFFYDGASRRSRTFHPKHFNMDKEKARLAAVEFMKSLENNGRKKSIKNKPGRHKSKQMNEAHMNTLHNNSGDVSNSLNSLNASNNNLQMQMMTLNPAFYIPNVSRNYPMSNISPNERNNLSNTFSTLGSTTNAMNNITKGMQEHNALYLHNNNNSNNNNGGGSSNAGNNTNNNNNNNNNNSNNNNNNTNNSNSGNNNVGNGNNGNSSLFAGNGMHMLNSSSGNLNNNNNNNLGNNMHYLNDLIFRSNIISGGTGGGAGGSGGAAGNINFHDRNLGNTNVNDILELEENLGLQSKDVENLVNAFFRQNYNMNINLSNIDKHFLHSTGGNNNNSSNPLMGTPPPPSAGGAVANNSHTTRGNHTSHRGHNGHANHSGHVSHGNHSSANGSNTNNNSGNTVASLNSNSSQNTHLYIPGHSNDVYENNNESSTNNGANSLVNFYDYNFDMYRGGNLSPHILDMVHRMNNDLKEVKNLDNMNDDVSELSFHLHDNSAWINQLRHSHNNLCNNLNNNHCDLCDPSVTPEHGMKNQLDLNKRKKPPAVINMSNRKGEQRHLDENCNNCHTSNGGNSGGHNSGNNTKNMNAGNTNNGSSTSFEMSTRSCSCPPQLSNQKNHYCLYYNHSNPSPQNENNYNNYINWNSNASNNMMNNVEENDGLVDNNPSGNTTSGTNRNMGETNSTNSAALCITSNNNRNNGMQQSTKHISQNMDMKNKQSAHTSSQYGTNTSMQDIQQLHFQSQPNMNPPPPDLHNAMSMVKQSNNYPQKGINNNNSNTGGPNNTAGSSNTNGNKKKTAKEGRKTTTTPHAINMPQQQAKKNSANTNYLEHNNVCTKLNSIINIEWVSSDLKVHQNVTKQGSYENENA